MRKRLYTLIEKAEPGDRLSQFYDVFMVAVAFASVVPLMFKTSSPALETLDLITVYVLFADYIFRWMTSDFASGKKGPAAFVRYPFTPYALLVLLSLLPSMGLLGQGFRILRLFRISALFRYSNNFRYVTHVFRKEKKTLLSVLWIALFYIFLSALAMFTYEPDTFKHFFEALYWATTALTTVGYGDVSPVSEVGQFISMVSSLFGIAVIALPAGIVTAGFVDEINKNTRERAEAEARPRPAATPLLPAATPQVRRYAAVMLLGLGLNVGLNALSQALNLPLWLDTTGTALAAFVLEPAAGLVIGLADNMLLAGFEFGAGALLYYSVSAVVALVAGAFLWPDGRFAPRRLPAAIGLVVLLSTLLNGSIDLWVGGGGAPATYWEHAFYTAALGAGLPHIAACYAGELAVKVADTVATAGLTTLLAALLPAAWRRPLKQPHNAK